MTSRPRLWLLCGPSFAGKSTLPGDPIFTQHVRTFEWPTDDESPVGCAAEDRFATWWPRVETVRGSSDRG